ncbi:hypothetical protein GF406_10570 [candidate division KSB1 bacterium]|nr:hypothetical protein [candidate division KSB1 bacterium]
MKYLTTCIIITMTRSALSILLLIPVFFSFSCSQVDQKRFNQNRIQPYTENPTYWQYQSKPVLLVGTSSDDNLFQSDTLERELDSIVSHGGNYLRCTMSGRDSGNVKPFVMSIESPSKYDLENLNPEYWQKFEHFLQATHERQMFVQIEVWASYDFYERAGLPWRSSPFNPVNNVNYTTAETGLPSEFHSRGFEAINPFFESVPSLKNIPLVLRYQQAFVDKLLSISLSYDHVLYCMDNETNAHPKWSEYWAEYIKKKASLQGLDIETTEMWDTADPSNGAVPDAYVQDVETHPFITRSNVSVTLQNPAFYTYLDISNHNAQKGQVHFETGYYVWTQVQESGILRPINCVKIYGGGDDENSWGGDNQAGQERFWRNVFAGIAAVRFHRAPAGLGHSSLALRHVKSMRMLMDELDIFSCRPNNDLLSDRQVNEAYCLADPGRACAVVFLDGGQCGLELSAMQERIRVRWLDILNSQWQPEIVLNKSDTLNLSAPDNGFWGVLIEKAADR